MKKWDLGIAGRSMGFTIDDSMGNFQIVRSRELSSAGLVAIKGTSSVSARARPEYLPLLDCLGKLRK